MRILNTFEADVPGKGLYENEIDDDGVEYEFLNGAGLRNGCYCKHYRQARDWTDKTTLDANGRPVMQHYCAKTGEFLGFAYCCGYSALCFEPGKSAGIKRILNVVRKHRMYG